MAGFFLQFTFPFPHQLPTPPLKVLPLPTMSIPIDHVLLAARNFQYEEVWGMDNQDFYKGTNDLVRVVKPLGICPGV